MSLEYGQLGGTLEKALGLESGKLIFISSNMASDIY